MLPNSRFSLLGPVLVLALTAGLAGGLQAQGSSVYVQGSCMTGLAGAGVASPCPDASAVFFNPAALVLQPTQATLGFSAIITGGGFTYDPVHGGEAVSRETATVPVPHGYVNWNINERLSAALGVFAPYGLSIAWPLEFEGRFVGYDNALQGLYIQPTVSYALAPGLLYVGGGVDFVRGEIEINQRLDAWADPNLGALGFLPGTDFADVRLAGDGWGTTVHVGVKAHLAPNLEFGARYLHSVDIDLRGTAEFEQIPTGVDIIGIGPADAVISQAFPADQEVGTSITFPNMAVVGLAYRPIDPLRVLLDYQWTGWSTFRQFDIDFAQQPGQTLILDYRDASTYRIGAELAVAEALDLRAGFIYNTAATPDETVTPLLPEAERNYYTAGIGYRVGGARIDLGYQFIDQADRRGRVRGRPTRDLTAEELNRGLFTGTGHVLGLTISYAFGGAL